MTQPKTPRETAQDLVFDIHPSPTDEDITMVAAALVVARSEGFCAGRDAAADLCEREAIAFRQQRSTTDAVVATMLGQRLRALKPPEEP